MLEHQIEINRLAAEFESCRQLLQALGDENRQHLILEMMRMGKAWMAKHILPKQRLPATAPVTKRLKPSKI